MTIPTEFYQGTSPVKLPSNTMDEMIHLFDSIAMISKANAAILMEGYESAKADLTASLGDTLWEKLRFWEATSTRQQSITGALINLNVVRDNLESVTKGRMLSRADREKYIDDSILLLKSAKKFAKEAGL